MLLQVNMDDPVPPSQSLKRKGRGAAKSLKTTEAMTMVLQFNNLHQPVGPWQQQYGKHIGHCAARISINCRTWADVPEELQRAMWEDTKVWFFCKCKIS